MHIRQSMLHLVTGFLFTAFIAAAGVAVACGGGGGDPHGFTGTPNRPSNLSSAAERRAAIQKEYQDELIRIWTIDFALPVTVNIINAAVAPHEYLAVWALTTSMEYVGAYPPAPSTDVGKIANNLTSLVTRIDPAPIISAIESFVEALQKGEL